jgi:hypothetical protein
MFVTAFALLSALIVLVVPSQPTMAHRCTENQLTPFIVLAQFNDSQFREIREFYAQSASESTDTRLVFSLITWIFSGINLKGPINGRSQVWYDLRLP